MKLRSSFIIFTFLLTLSGNIPAADYETSASFNAAKVLPPELVKGPSHEVLDPVVNDGFLNFYTIQSPYGTVKAVSTATLRKYVREINAVARMHEIRASKQFMDGVREKAGDVAAGGKALVTDPVNTVSDSISGVGKLFSRGKENLLDGSRSSAEESRMKDLIGFSKSKRDYAYEFGVDPYSRNPVLQEELDKIAWAGFTGGITASAALMAVPGGAGIAVSAAGNTKLMSEIFRDRAPADLRSMNRDRLQQMGVAPDAVDLFLSNANFSPREQTLLVDALNGMPQTKDRAAFVKFAVLTDSPDVAHFRQRQAQMYAGYNRAVEPIARFVQFGEVSAARTADGKLVFNVPLDHALWTKGIANITEFVTQEADVQKIRERHLWVAGSLSPTAKRSMEKLGWAVHQNAERKLLAGAVE